MGSKHIAEMFENKTTELKCLSDFLNKQSLMPDFFLEGNPLMGISAEIEIEFDTGCGAVGQKGKNTHVSHTHKIYLQ